MTILPDILAMYPWLAPLATFLGILLAAFFGFFRKGSQRKSALPPSSGSYTLDSGVGRRHNDILREIAESLKTSAEAQKKMAVMLEKSVENAQRAAELAALRRELRRQKDDE